MSHENSEKSLSKISVRDVMSGSIISADPSTTVYQIAKLMEKGEVGAIFVKKDNRPTGIITDRDFAIKIASQKYPFDTPVHKVASYPLQTIDVNESIGFAAYLMSEKKIRKLAVVENKKVVGIVTSTNLVKQLALMYDK